MYNYQALVLKVVDGDTVDLQVDLGFSINYANRFRVLDYDAPESRLIRGADQVEKDLGHSAKLIAIKLLSNQIVNVTTIKDSRDKYGRYLCSILIPDTCPIEEYRKVDYATLMKTFGLERGKVCCLDSLRKLEERILKSYVDR